MSIWDKAFGPAEMISSRLKISKIYDGVIMAVQKIDGEEPLIYGPILGKIMAGFPYMRNSGGHGYTTILRLLGNSTPGYGRQIYDHCSVVSKLFSIPLSLSGNSDERVSVEFSLMPPDFALNYRSLCFRSPKQFALAPQSPTPTRTGAFSSCSASNKALYLCRDDHRMAYIIGPIDKLRISISGSEGSATLYYNGSETKELVTTLGKIRGYIEDCNLVILSDKEVQRLTSAPLRHRGPKLINPTEL